MINGLKERLNTRVLLMGLVQIAVSFCHC
ncbi:hypothetical protein NC651_010860 [Populus alba x Populus x berolinensis]|nr:hypothetical protein NC651_010860 [Populus alba x Populus x berolinensis]